MPASARTLVVLDDLRDELANRAAVRPDVDVGPESLAPASPAQPTGTRRHARILVVDDDSQVLSSITEMLRSVGHTVSPSSTGRAAIAEYQPGRFDIVITNIGMAGMNGWEVA